MALFKTRGVLSSLAARARLGRRKLSSEVRAAGDPVDHGHNRPSSWGQEEYNNEKCASNHFCSAHEKQQQDGGGQDALAVSHAHALCAPRHAPSDAS